MRIVTTVFVAVQARFPLLLTLVPLFKHIPGLLALTLVADEALHVVVVLDACEYAAWRAEVFQNPGRGACQAVNLIEHGEVLAIEVLLKLLRPARAGDVRYGQRGAGKIRKIREDVL